jgi:Xaa-Pro aminopeptidase
MIVSNEPGFYKTGHYGIRIENLQLVVERPDLSSREGGEFFGFEPLTLVPYSRTLIDPSLLSIEERHQIDDYHRAILDALTPELEPAAATWLLQECQPLSE